jgi:hypothetical protein
MRRWPCYLTVDSNQQQKNLARHPSPVTRHPSPVTRHPILIRSMRTLCLILILVNALYFIWSQMIDVQVNALDRAPSRIAEPPPRIVLAREVQETQPTEEPAEIRDVEPPRVSAIESPTQNTARAMPNDSFTCTSIGPFADLAEASQAQASLREAGFSPQQRVEQGELWVGYWVSVQDLSSREVAEAAMQSLQSNDITDVYLMPGGENGQTLSLGVFSDHQRAQRRADQARALGLDARIEDRKRAGSVYWLDVELSAPGQVIDTSIFQSDPGKIMRLEMRQCPEARSG